VSDQKAVTQEPKIRLAISLLAVVFLLFFCVITTVGIYVLYTPESKNVVQIVQQTEPKRVANIYWDTRYLMSGHLNTTIGKKVFADLEVLFKQYGNLQGFRYQGVSANDCTILPVGDKGKGFTEIDRYDSYAYYSNEVNWNAFPAAIGPIFFNKMNPSVQKDDNNALEVMITNTWFDIKENEFHPGHQTLIDNLITLLESAENCSLVYFELPWACELTNNEPRDKAVYVLVLGGQKPVFDFTESLLIKLGELLDIDTFGVAMRDLTYDRPIFVDKQDTEPKSTFPVLSVSFSPSYSYHDKNQIFYVKPAEILVENKSKNLEVKTNVMRYKDGVGMREGSMHSAAYIEVPFKYTANEVAVFRKLGLDILLDDAVKISYCIDTNNSSFNDLIFEQWEKDNASNDEGLLDGKYGVRIPIAPKYYNSAAVFSVIVRLQLIVPTDFQEAFISFLRDHDVSMRQTIDSQRIEHDYMDYFKNHPELTHGVCELFIEGWGKDFKERYASKSRLSNSLDEVIIQEAFMEFPVKGSWIGSLKDFCKAKICRRMK
jgi:hypothetical protein